MKLFNNKGFGWYCVACSAKLSGKSEMPRLMNEGEAEAKELKLSDSALASWTDGERTELACKICGAKESITL